MADSNFERCGTRSKPNQAATLAGQVMSMADIADVFRPEIRRVLAAKPDWPERMPDYLELLLEDGGGLAEDILKQLLDLGIEPEDPRLDPAEIRDMVRTAVEEETARLVRVWLNKLKVFRCRDGVMMPRLSADLLPPGAQITAEDMAMFDLLSIDDVYQALRAVADGPKRQEVERAALIYLTL